MLPSQLSPNLGKHKILVPFCEREGTLTEAGRIWPQKSRNIFPLNSWMVLRFFENFTGIFPTVAGKELI